MAKKMTVESAKGGGGDPKYFAVAPIRRLMKKEGAHLVAIAALKKLTLFLEESGAEVTQNAIKVCKADKRKRVTASDIRNATR